MGQTTAISPVSSASPVAQRDRIALLDSLRGIAILGILLMNIPSFAYPAGDDPSIYYESGLNYKVWWLVNLIPEGTQRALFSILFGAGILLFIQSQQKKVSGLQPADYFFRRQLWLIAFSLFDVYVLLWQGDILFDYACYGMMLFVFRNLSPKKLLIAAGICFLFIIARENRDLYLSKQLIHRGEVAATIDTTNIKLAPLQKDDLAAMQGFKEENTLASKQKNAEKLVLKLTGPHDRLYEDRTGRYIHSLIVYTYMSLWDVLLFMFLGMAFFKSGLLLGKAPIKVYWAMFIIGLGLGIFFAYTRIQLFRTYHFNYYEYVKGTGFELYQVSRVFRSLGILGLIMLLYRSSLFKWFFSLFRPVGQMAFTNYLMQSLICAILFYGIGFALFGKLQRYQIYIVVGCIWVFQIIFCHIWMRFFNFGPFEWAWRSLTYWKRQDMTRNKIS